MATINRIMDQLHSHQLSRNVQSPYHEARDAFRLDERDDDRSSFSGFARILGLFYSHMHRSCIAPGSELPLNHASELAKQALMRKRRDDPRLVGAFRDARDGVNGSLRKVLDDITESLIGDATMRYVRGVFDRFISPDDRDAQVEVMRQFIERHGPSLGPSIDTSRPDRYAHQYDELIDRFAQSLNEAGQRFRAY